MDKRDLIKQATKYRSGPDSCNSLYMGGMAHAQLCRDLGVSYPTPNGIEDAIDKATDAQIDTAYERLSKFIDKMQKKPMRHCQCCGQVMEAKEVIVPADNENLAENEWAVMIRIPHALRDETMRKNKLVYTRARAVELIEYIDSQVPKAGKDD